MSTANAINPFAKVATGNATNPVEPETVEETVEATAAPEPATKPAPKAKPAPGGAKTAAAGLPVPGAPAPSAQANDASPMPGLPMPNMSNPHGAGDFEDDFVIDLSDVVQGGRDYIGIGRHLLAATAVDTGFSKEGNRKLTFTYEVISGDFVGKKATSHVAMHLDWKIDQHLRAMGIVNAERKKPTLGEIKRECVGRVVIGDFVKSTYNGRDSVDFNRVDPPDEIGISAGTTVDNLLAGQTD
jgi:hypothetical protein